MAMSTAMIIKTAADALNGAAQPSTNLNTHVASQPVPSSNCRCTDIAAAADINMTTTLARYKGQYFPNREIMGALFHYEKIALQPSEHG
jgi:hypothetical protein